MSEDILQEIPDQDLPLLSELYRPHEEKAPHVYSTINTVILWKKRKPNTNYMTVYGVNRDWLKTGTFIVLKQFQCYDIFFYTLQDDCTPIYEALTQTKKIEWSDRVVWFAILDRHIPTLNQIIMKLEPEKPLPVFVETGMWVIEKEKALEFDTTCPDDVYIAELNESHVDVINSIWPHKYEGSEHFISVLIAMNTSYGVFLKSDDSLVAWVIKSTMGQMTLLQTVPEHLRKGYAMLITKFMSKEIAQGGHTPLGTILTNNKASQRMFERLGFKCIDKYFYVSRIWG